MLKENLLNESTSFLKDNVNDLKSSLNERLKLPILISYGIILLFYNWDVIYFIIFNSDNAYEKIEFIRKNFTDSDHRRYTTPFLLSIVTTFTFPAVQVFINLILNTFKKIDSKLVASHEIDKAIIHKSLIDIRSGNKDKENMQVEIESLKGNIEALNMNANVLKTDYDKILEDKNLLEHLVRKNDRNNFYVKELLRDMFSRIDTTKMDVTLTWYNDLIHYYDNLISVEKSILKSILENLTIPGDMSLNDLVNVIFVRFGNDLSRESIEKILLFMNTNEYINTEETGLVKLTEKGESIEKFVSIFNL